MSEVVQHRENTHDVLSSFGFIISQVADDGQNAGCRVDKEELVNVVWY